MCEHQVWIDGGTAESGSPTVKSLSYCRVTLLPSQYPKHPATRAEKKPSPEYEQIIQGSEPSPDECEHTLECGVVAEAVLRLGHADWQLVKAQARVPV